MAYSEPAHLSSPLIHLPKRRYQRFRSSRSFLLRSKISSGRSIRFVLSKSALTAFCIFRIISSLSSSNRACLSVLTTLVKRINTKCNYIYIYIYTETCVGQTNTNHAITTPFPNHVQLQCNMPLLTCLYFAPKMFLVLCFFLPPQRIQPMKIQL